jgi:hypothetical protein
MLSFITISSVFLSIVTLTQAQQFDNANNAKQLIVSLNFSSSKYLELGDTIFSTSFHLSLRLPARLNTRLIDIELQASDASLPSGKYLVRNVKTGQTLAFIRDVAASRTNVYPQSGDNPIDMERYGDGMILSGGNSKCLSAQWNIGSTGSFNHAGVSYGCQSESLSYHLYGKRY